MGLRARLALFFVAITVLPLTVAVAVLGWQLDNRLDALAARELQASSNAAVTVVDAAAARAAATADVLAATGATVLASGDVGGAADLVAAADPSVDIVVLATADGEGLAERLEPPSFSAPLDVPTAADLAAAAAAGTRPDGVLWSVHEVRGPAPADGVIGFAAAGVWVDDALVDALPGGVGAAVIDGGRVVGFAGSDPGDTPDVAPGQRLRTSVDGVAVNATAHRLTTAAEPRLVVWQAAPPGVGAAPFLLLLPAIALAAAAGWLLAGGVVAPIEAAAAAARAIAAGDLGQRLDPVGPREAADLAMALNTMSADLAARVAELERSRDELRRSLDRFGESLSSSLDLDRTLALVVETAMDTMGADRGLLRLFTPERDALYVKIGRGVGRDVPQVAIGDGLAGAVAVSGTGARIPSEGAPAAAPTEPAAPQQLAVPMTGRGRVIGVLALLRDNDEPAWTDDDLATLRSFAAQSSVAMENVLLHQEAQRLSVTDPLTGLWNFRYFQLQADRELESAARFSRPLSLLIIDLDRFKAVNDTYGHQVGDEVLVEVARRIQGATRVPDVVARYGGEEFIVLLPGTALEGATATGERIRAAVSDSPVPVATADGVSSLVVTCSVGSSAFPVHGGTVAKLLRIADGAMYQAKALGRDRVVAADAP